MNHLATDDVVQPNGHPGTEDDDDLGFRECLSCGEDFYPEQGEVTCGDCQNHNDQTFLLGIFAEATDDAALLEHLSIEMKRVTDDHLIDEAIYYLKLGDAAEARFRANLYAKPKFQSEQQCAARYALAMMEKHTGIIWA